MEPAQGYCTQTFSSAHLDNSSVTTVENKALLASSLQCDGALHQLFKKSNQVLLLLRSAGIGIDGAGLPREALPVLEVDHTQIAEFSDWLHEPLLFEKKFPFARQKLSLSCSLWDILHFFADKSSELTGAEKPIQWLGSALLWWLGEEYLRQVLRTWKLEQEAVEQILKQPGVRSLLERPPHDLDFRVWFKGVDANGLWRVVADFEAFLVSKLPKRFLSIEPGDEALDKYLASLERRSIGKSTSVANRYTNLQRYLVRCMCYDRPPNLDPRGDSCLLALWLRTPSQPLQPGTSGLASCALPIELILCSQLRLESLEEDQLRLSWHPRRAGSLQPQGGEIGNGHRYVMHKLCGTHTLLDPWHNRHDVAALVRRLVAFARGESAWCEGEEQRVWQAIQKESQFLLHPAGYLRGLLYEAARRLPFRLDDAIVLVALQASLVWQDKLTQEQWMQVWQQLPTARKNAKDCKQKLRCSDPLLQAVNRMARKDKLQQVVNAAKIVLTGALPSYSDKKLRLSFCCYQGGWGVQCEFLIDSQVMTLLVPFGDERLEKMFHKHVFRSVNAEALESWTSFLMERADGSAKWRSRSRLLALGGFVSTDIEDRAWDLLATRKIELVFLGLIFLTSAQALRERGLGQLDWLRYVARLFYVDASPYSARAYRLVRTILSRNPTLLESCSLPQETPSLRQWMQLLASSSKEPERRLALDMWKDSMSIAQGMDGSWNLGTLLLRKFIETDLLLGAELLSALPEPTTKIAENSLKQLASAICIKACKHKLSPAKVLQIAPRLVDLFTTSARNQAQSDEGLSEAARWMLSELCNASLWREAQTLLRYVQKAPPTQRDPRVQSACWRILLHKMSRAKDIESMLNIWRTMRPMSSECPHQQKNECFTVADTLLLLCENAPVLQRKEALLAVRELGVTGERKEKLGKQAYEMLLEVFSGPWKGTTINQWIQECSLLLSHEQHVALLFAVTANAIPRGKFKLAQMSLHNLLEIVVHSREKQEVELQYVNLVLGGLVSTNIDACGVLFKKMHKAGLCRSKEVQLTLIQIALDADKASKWTMQLASCVLRSEGLLYPEVARAILDGMNDRIEQGKVSANVPDMPMLGKLLRSVLDPGQLSVLRLPLLRKILSSEHCGKIDSIAQEELLRWLKNAEVSLEDKYDLYQQITDKRQFESIYTKRIASLFESWSWKCLKVNNLVLANACLKERVALGKQDVASFPFVLHAAVTEAWLSENNCRAACTLQIVLPSGAEEKVGQGLPLWIRAIEQAVSFQDDALVQQELPVYMDVVVHSPTTLTRVEQVLLQLVSNFSQTHEAIEGNWLLMVLLKARSQNTYLWSEAWPMVVPYKNAPIVRTAWDFWKIFGLTDQADSLPTILSAFKALVAADPSYARCELLENTSTIDKLCQKFHETDAAAALQALAIAEQAQGLRRIIKEEYSVYLRRVCQRREQAEPFFTSATGRNHGNVLDWQLALWMLKAPHGEWLGSALELMERLSCHASFQQEQAQAALPALEQLGVAMRAACRRKSHVVDTNWRHFVDQVAGTDQLPTWFLFQVANSAVTLSRHTEGLHTLQKLVEALASRIDDSMQHSWNTLKSAICKYMPDIWRVLWKQQAVQKHLTDKDVVEGLNAHFMQWKEATIGVDAAAAPYSLSSEFTEVMVAHPRIVEQPCYRVFCQHLLKTTYASPFPLSQFNSTLGSFSTNIPAPYLSHWLKVDEERQYTASSDPTPWLTFLEVYLQGKPLEASPIDKSVLRSSIICLRNLPIELVQAQPQIKDRFLDVTRKLFARCYAFSSCSGNEDWLSKKKLQTVMDRWMLTLMDIKSDAFLEIWYRYRDTFPKIPKNKEGRDRHRGIVSKALRWALEVGTPNTLHRFGELLGETFQELWLPGEESLWKPLWKEWLIQAQAHPQYHHECMFLLHHVFCVTLLLADRLYTRKDGTAMANRVKGQELLHKVFSSVRLAAKRDIPYFKPGGKSAELTKAAYLRSAGILQSAIHIWTTATVAGAHLGFTKSLLAPWEDLVSLVIHSRVQQDVQTPLIAAIASIFSGPAALIEQTGDNVSRQAIDIIKRYCSELSQQQGMAKLAHIDLSQSDSLLGFFPQDEKKLLVQQVSDCVIQQFILTVDQLYGKIVNGKWQSGSQIRNLFRRMLWICKDATDAGPLLSNPAPVLAQLEKAKQIVDCFITSDGEELTEHVSMMKTDFVDFCRQIEENLPEHAQQIQKIFHGYLVDQ